MHLEKTYKHYCSPTLSTYEHQERNLTSISPLSLRSCQTRTSTFLAATPRTHPPPPPARRSLPLWSRPTTPSPKPTITPTNIRGSLTVIPEQCHAHQWLRTLTSPSSTPLTPRSRLTVLRCSSTSANTPAVLRFVDVL